MNKLKNILNKIKVFMNKVYDKFNKIEKRFKIVIGISLAIVVVLFVVTSINVSDSKTMSDRKRFSLEYEKLNGKETSDLKKYPKVNISKNNIFKYSSLNEVKEMMKNNGDGVVYFGYSECLYCRNAVQVLHDVASDTKLDVIYYVDVSKEKEEIQKFYESIRQDLLISVDGVKMSDDAFVIFIADGSIVSYHLGTVFSQENPYEPLDKWQLYGIQEIYGSGINDVLRSIENKKRTAG